MTNLTDLEPVPGTICTPVGWGKLAENETGTSDSLQKVELRIWENCTINNQTVDLMENICAGEKEGGKDTCQGNHYSSDDVFWLFQSSLQSFTRDFDPQDHRNVILLQRVQPACWDVGPARLPSAL